MKKKFTLQQDMEYRYSSTLSFTSALDGGVWSMPRPDRFTLRKETRYPLYGGLGGCQERSGRQQKTWSTPGSDPRTVKPVANRLHQLNYPSLKATCNITTNAHRETTRKGEQTPNIYRYIYTHTHINFYIYLTVHH
jgi:hypothetical protein